MVFISKFIRPALSQLARKNFFAIGLPEKWGESRRVEGGGYGTRTHFPLAHPPPSTFQFLSECVKALLRGSYGNTFQAGYRLQVYKTCRIFIFGSLWTSLVLPKRTPPISPQYGPLASSITYLFSWPVFAAGIARAPIGYILKVGFFRKTFSVFP